MALYRTSTSHEHSHTVELPSTVPSERSVFYTSSSGEDWHAHVVLFGGDVGFGLVTTEPAGSDEAYVSDPYGGSLGMMPRGKVIPEREPSSFEHTHVIHVMR